MPQGHRTPMTRTQRAQLSALARDNGRARAYVRTLDAMCSRIQRGHGPVLHTPEPVGLHCTTSQHGQGGRDSRPGSSGRVTRRPTRPGSRTWRGPSRRCRRISWVGEGA